MAVFNGSLVQLLRNVDRIKDVAFHLCNQYSDWEFRVLLLKIAMSNGNSKEVKDLISLFNDVYGKMNADDSKNIFEYVKSNPIKYKKDISQLIAFQHLGYFFSDEYYIKVWEAILIIIDDWIKSKNRIIILGDYIFDALKNNLLRIDNNLVVSNIILRLFDSGLIRFYDKALEVITMINFEDLTEDNKKFIINQIERLIENEPVRKNCANLEGAIIAVRKKNPKLSEAINQSVMMTMPEFYKSNYSLEIEVGSQAQSEEYIYRFVAEIVQRNKTQGQHGTYIGYMDNPYKTIENIIAINDIQLGEEVVNSIISASRETLYAEKQTLDAKVQAINLISFLRVVSNESIFDFKQLIDQIINDKDEIFKGKDDMFEDMFIDRTSNTTLHFNFMMMKLVFNVIKIEEIMDLLSSYTDLEAFEKLEALKTMVSIFEYEKSDIIDEKIILMILQFTLGATNDNNHDVRFYATKVLLHIICEGNKDPIMKRLLKTMDYDSIFIKHQIMNSSEKLKAIDKASFDFIREKALVDNHFVIRKKALKL